MTSERDDKRTLGVTAEGATALSAIMETGWFDDEMDAYRVAISLAFAHDVLIAEGELTGVTTKWNVGTLDPTGTLRSLVEAMSEAPVTRPYATAERRAHAGLVLLKRQLVDEKGELSDVLTVPNA